MQDAPFPFLIYKPGKLYYACFEQKGNYEWQKERKQFTSVRIVGMRKRSILQNTSLLPELKEQLDKPEKWYDYTYTNATVENGLISTYAQYEQNIKERISKQT